MNREPDLGEKALDKAAEVVLKNQLDRAEQVDVDIRTDPGKVAQGKVDSIAIAGEGMVMKQDLRVEAAEVHANSVAINPFKAILGEIELTRPTDAQVQILLTEADLNRALASDYLRNKMKGLQIEIQQEPVTVDIQQMNLHLPNEQKMVFDAEIWVSNSNETKQFSAVAKPFLQDNGQRIEFEIMSAEGRGLSLEFITALFTRLVELLDLRRFDLDGASVQLRDLDIQVGKLLLRGVTSLEKIPTL